MTGLYKLPADRPMVSRAGPWVPRRATRRRRPRQRADILLVPMRLGRHYLISGRVTGVGFRVFATAAAAREGVHGWVRNLPHGRVEITAEGDREALDRFERMLRQGPPAARVDEVDVTDVGAAGRDVGFEVRE